MRDCVPLHQDSSALALCQLLDHSVIILLHTACVRRLFDLTSSPLLSPSLASAIGAPVEPLLEGIESELAAAGQPLDQKWPKGAKRKAVMAAVRRLADAGGAPVYTRLQAYFASAEANEEDGGDAGEEDDADGGNGGEDVSETLVEFVGMVRSTFDV